MHSHDGQDYYTVGEVAAAVGVSPQMLRVWERKGLLIPARRSGRQRLYSEDHLQRAGQIVHLRRRHGWNPAAIGSAASLEAAARPVAGRLVGPRIQAARLARERTLADLADQTGISSSFLYSVERGESGISVQVLSRLADALEIPMSGFASPRRNGRVSCDRMTARERCSREASHGKNSSRRGRRLSPPSYTSPRAEQRRPSGPATR